MKVGSHSCNAVVPSPCQCRVVGRSCSGYITTALTNNLYTVRKKKERTGLGVKLKKE